MSKYPSHQEQLRFFRDAVKFAAIVRDSNNKPIATLRPATFAVLTTYMEVGTENWGFDANAKYEDFYFNRDNEIKGGAVTQEKIAYPAACMITAPSAISYKNFFDPKRQKVVEYDLTIIDYTGNDRYNDKYRTRSKQSMIMDCEQILEAILLYYLDMVFVSYNVDATDKLGWFNRGEIAWLLAENKIDSYAIDERTTGIYFNRIKEINGGSFSGDVVKDLSINGVYGLYVGIKLPIEQCAAGEYTFKEYGKDYKFGKCH